MRFSRTLLAAEMARSSSVGGLAPDFTLTDVNTNSATYNADVSPGDYLTTVSAWYFAPAT